MPIHHGRVPEDHLPPKMRKGGGKWIQKVTEAPGFRKGALTRKAHGEHMETMSYAHYVLQHPEEYSERTYRQAQFAVNAQMRK